MTHFWTGASVADPLSQPGISLPWCPSILNYLSIKSFVLQASLQLDEVSWSRRSPMVEMMVEILDKSTVELILGPFGVLIE